MYLQRPKRYRLTGFTLIEMLLASAIMAVFAGTISLLAMAVQQNSQHSNGLGMATQHARIVIERIERYVSEAQASSQFPGCLVLNTSVKGIAFPEALVVWRGDMIARNPDGRPHFDELVIFCPDGGAPNRLLEITLPNDSRMTPAATDTASWLAELANLKVSNNTTRVDLTDRLRVIPLDNSIAANQLGAIRFAVQSRPSDTQLASYAAGTTAWTDLPWPQGLSSPRSGLRQTWCRLELQLTTEADGMPANSTAALTFFGSASNYHLIQP